VGTRISRRELLASAAPAIGCVGLAAVFPLALQGCGAPAGRDLDQRITGALRQVVAENIASGQLSRSLKMTKAEALQLLRGDLTALRLYALTSNRFCTRRFIADRRAQDLRAGRIRYVDGWLLAESEVAIAVVLGF
jgi:hypothetical protein